MQNLIEWSYKMQGAREMLQHLRDEHRRGARIDLDPAPHGDGKVFTEAIFDLVLKKALTTLTNTCRAVKSAIATIRETRKES